MIPLSKPGKALGLTLLFLSLLCTCVRAQDIRVSVIVPNPPPVYWDAYLEFEADVRIILTNVTTESRELKLIPNLTSDRGLTAALRPGFQPMNPIVIGGGETMNLTYRDLRAIFGTPTEADIQLGGISFDRLFESETIPEGSYTLCVEARDFVTNEPLSNNFGCDVFYVQQHEPPLIIYPDDGTLVTATDPQFVNFLWSTTGIPGRVRYRFSLYDLDELGLNNRADAFLLAATQPLLEIDDLMSNTLAYDLGYPPLTPGRHYAIQVIAYDPNGELLFSQEGRSQVHQFQYIAPLQVIISDPNIIDNDLVIVTPGNDNNGGNGDITPPNIVNNGNQQQQANVQNGCPPLPPPAATPFPNAISIGQTISVGGYQMELLSGGGNSPIAGTGRVLVPAFNTFVNVEFTGLDVNTDLEAYGEGDVVRAIAGSNLIPNSLLENLSDGELDENDLAESAAGQLRDFVMNNGNWLDPEAPGTHPAVNMPAGVMGAGMDLIVTGMEFTPLGGVMAAYVQVELPEAQDDRRLLLVGKGICLSEDNLGQGGDLLLGNDQTIALSDGVDLTFLGGEDGTSVAWSENGVNSLDVHGRLTFDQDVVATEGQPLTASFTATVEDYQDWTATVTLSSDEWAVPGLEDFQLSLLPGTIVYDHSSVSGPPGFELPGNHTLAGNENIWQGVYIPGLAFSFPEGIDAEVNIEDIVLDQQGVWMEVDINGNILSFGDDADIGNWPLAINHLGLDVRGSSVESASFGGAIKLPISETALDFSVPIGEGGDFSLALDIDGELDVEMWVAELNLENSSIGVDKVGNSYVPTATLNGSISIGWDEGDDQENSAVSNFNLPGINFQDFTITGGAGMPQLDGIFGLDLEDYSQGGLANFPLHFVTDDDLFDPIEFMVNGNEIGLRLNLGLNLTQQSNGFGGTTAFSIFADWNPGDKNFTYDRTQIDQITVFAELNLISFNGSLTFYNGDATYGDGFDGEIKVGIQNVGAGLDMRLQVGRAQQGFRYFMVDALLRLPLPGIVMTPTPLAIQGFGGGFWYNMTRTPTLPEEFMINDAVTVDQSDNDPGQGASATFSPEEGTFGFSAKVVLALAAADRALNADLTFGMEMDDDLSLNSVFFEGNLYMMQSMDDREGGFLTGGAELNLDFVGQNYTFTSFMDIGLPAGVAFNFDLDAGFSTNPDLNPKPWHLYLGKWTEDTDPREDEARMGMTTEIDFGFAKFNSGSRAYFMMGNVMPQGLPDVPQEIISLLGEEGKSPPQTALLPVQTTEGFAFGAVRFMDFGFNARIFRLDASWTWGFDLLLSDKTDQNCDAEDFGINNWYADAQAFAYLGVSGSVEGKLFGKKRKFKFAEIEAGAILKFAGPNPLWLKGNARIRGNALGNRIKFDTRVGFEFGEKVNCRDGEGSIFDDIPIVQGFDPEDGKTGRSIFTTPQVAFNFPRGAFPIEEETDDGDYVTNYYGYEEQYFKVYARRSTSLKGQDNFLDPANAWKLVPGVQAAQYSQDGYSAKYRIDGELPPYSDIRLDIEVLGVRYTNSTGNTVAKSFEKQRFIATFETGPPPDHIIFGSIDDSRPFRRQLYFHPQDETEGMLSFHHPQWSELFRKVPNFEDKLDPAGRFNYVARIISLTSGQYRDMPIDDSDMELTFPLPQSFLQPEKIYRINILRKYTAPAGQEGTNEVMVNLQLVEPNTPSASGNLVLGGFNPGGGGDPPGPGGGLTGTMTLANVQPGIGQQHGQLNQVAQFNLGEQQTQDDGPGGQITMEPIDPGPDPAPEFGITTLGDGPDLTGPGGLRIPGGDLGDLQRSSRELKKKGLTSSTVVKSLWPPGQGRWYFKTSKHPSRSQKINQLSVRPSVNPSTRNTAIPTDDLYNTNFDFIEVPYILLETDEGFDRFETTYHTKTYQAKDLEQDVGESATVEFQPAIPFAGVPGNWRDGVFYGDPENGGQSEGLFNSPLKIYSDWCYEQFFDPDNPINDTPLNPGGGPNALLHSFDDHTWDEYMKYDASYGDIAYDKRYQHIGPFGRSDYDRTIPPPHGAGQYYLYDAEAPLMEFAQFSSSGNKPSGLSGNAMNTHTRLTNAMINAVQPIDPLGGGIGTTLIFGQNDPGLNVNPGLNFDMQMNLNPQGSGGGNEQYVAVVDFTEWVTFQDYVLFRESLIRGLDELLNISNSSANSGTPYLNVNPEGLEECGHTFPIPDGSHDYNFFVWYYQQIRAYFKIIETGEPGLNNGAKTYFPYPARPSGDYQFQLGGRTFDYSLPQINHAVNKF